MTNHEIIRIIKGLNYAPVTVCIDQQYTTFGPGELVWRRDLRTATRQQKAMVAERLVQWIERLVGECSTVNASMRSSEAQQSPLLVKNAQFYGKDKGICQRRRVVRKRGIA